MMKSLNEVISVGKPQKTGVEYFIQYPHEFVQLIKRDFELACAYADVKSGKGFTAEEVHALFQAAKARKINLFEEMTKVLTQVAYRYNTIYVRSITTPATLDDASTRNLLKELFWRVCYSIDKGSYYDSLSGLWLFTHPSGNCIQQNNILTEANLTFYPDSIRKVQYDIFTRGQVLTHLPNLMHNLMEALPDTYALDHEFSYWLYPNQSARLLFNNKHYQPIADFLAHLTPQIAIKELAKPGENPDLLHDLVRALPDSLPAVTQAIDCMNDLEPEEFRIFIRANTQFDLLALLKAKAPQESTLVSDFCGISPSFLKDHFRQSAQGIEMPAESVGKPVTKWRNAKDSRSGDSGTPSFQKSASPKPCIVM